MTVWVFCPPMEIGPTGPQVFKGGATPTASPFGEGGIVPQTPGYWVLYGAGGIKTRLEARSPTGFGDLRGRRGPRGRWGPPLDFLKGGRVCPPPKRPGTPPLRGNLFYLKGWVSTKISHLNVIRPSRVISGAKGPQTLFFRPRAITGDHGLGGTGADRALLPHPAQNENF